MRSSGWPSNWISPRSWFEQARQREQQGAFARAVRPGHRQNFAPLDGQARHFQRDALFAPHEQVTDFDEGGHRRAPRCWIHVSA
jgi:hypothetical protein